MNTRMLMAAGLLAAVMGIGSLMPMSGQAANSRLDDAVAHLVKAKALVDAAEPSNAARNYLQHSRRAHDLIDQAIQQIALAKNAA